MSSPDSPFTVLPQHVLPLPFDPARLAGLSCKLLLSHHQNIYSAAVGRLNALRGELDRIPPDAMPSFALNGLKREELIATNSMLLHELYFDSLGGSMETMAPAMALALTGNFGSEVRWREEFTAMGKALAGGSGWVMLVFQPRDGTLVNQWGADHTHAIAGGQPVLALDMYEHAYHMDFGAAAGAYVDAFMANIHWAKVYARYQRAVHAASEEIALVDTSPTTVQKHLVLDVRRLATYAQSTTTLPGAQWRDPAAVTQWAGELPAGAAVLVYCVYGHEVSRVVALKLRALGVQANFLPGGMDGWISTSKPLQTKGQV